MKKLILLVAVLALLPVATASATAITGSSSGVFTSDTCTSGCGLANSNTTLWWGDGSYADGSRMTIVPVTYTATGLGVSFHIAEFEWRNSVDYSGTWAPNPFAALSTLTFAFTDPNVPNKVQTFNFGSIFETANNPADQTTLPSLAGLSFDLGGGYTIDTFTYSVTGAGSLSGLTWIGNEANSTDKDAYLTSDLYISAVAHFNPPPPPVPEPGSMLLLGTGLIGLGGAVRRRMQK